jgi:hypothetical protein
MALQLDEVLAMLHLLEEVVPWRLLTAGKRRQHPVTLEKAHDLVLQIAHGLTRGLN